MSENVMTTPLFHQRSHSMPVGRSFINGSPVLSHGNGSENENEHGNRSFDFKSSSPLKPELTTSEGFPLPIPKSLTSQFRTSPLSHPALSQNQLPAAAAAAATITAAITADDDIHNDDLDQEGPLFFDQPNNIINLFDYNKKTGVYPVILNCRMDRGFFVSQSHWTCYRRNYFQVTASLIIPGHSDQTYYALQLKPDRPMQPIQQFFLRLKACTSTSPQRYMTSEPSEPVLDNQNMVRPVALTQMTPKRDKGPQREPPTIPITPSDSVFGNEQVCVTFERLQFRVATANNGKRRASQQYFRLVFELVAQLDDASQHVVCECYSSPLVVRGRSPGHYSSEPQRDVRKKRKLTPPPPKKSTKIPSVGLAEAATTTNTTNTTAAAAAVAASPCTMTTISSPSPQQQQQYQHVVTLPPPQYVYNPPSLVVDTQRTSGNDNTSSSVPNSAHSPINFAHQQQQHLMPHMMNSAFSNFHARSQSANDSELFARHRHGMKYQSVVEHHHQQQQQQQQQQQHQHQQHHQQQQGHHDDMFDNYNVGIESALRNWQQQVVRQRTDSAATFDSYMSSSNNEHDNRPSTRPGTPIPYHAQQQQPQQQQQQQFYNPTSNPNWAPAANASPHPHPHPPSLPSRNHYQDKYEHSPKLYQQQSR